MRVYMEEEKELKFKDLYSRFFDKKNTSHLYYSWAGTKGYMYFCKELNKEKYQHVMEQRKNACHRYYQKNTEEFINKQLERYRRKKCQKTN